MLDGYLIFKFKRPLTKGDQENDQEITVIYYFLIKKFFFHFGQIISKLEYKIGNFSE
jgi:hypothetical protein